MTSPAFDAHLTWQMTRRTWQDTMQDCISRYLKLLDLKVKLTSSCTVQQHFAKFCTSAMEPNQPSLLMNQEWCKNGKIGLGLGIQQMCLRPKCLKKHNRNFFFLNFNLQNSPSSTTILHVVSCLNYDFCLQLHLSVMRINFQLDILEKYKNIHYLGCT